MVGDLVTFFNVFPHPWNYILHDFHDIMIVCKGHVKFTGDEFRIVSLILHSGTDIQFHKSSQCHQPPVSYGSNNYSTTRSNIINMKSSNNIRGERWYGKIRGRWKWIGIIATEALLLVILIPLKCGHRWNSESQSWLVLISLDTTWIIFKILFIGFTLLSSFRVIQSRYC